MKTLHTTAKIKIRWFLLRCAVVFWNCINSFIRLWCSIFTSSRRILVARLFIVPNFFYWQYIIGGRNQRRSRSYFPFSLVIEQSSNPYGPLREKDDNTLSTAVGSKLIDYCWVLLSGMSTGSRSTNYFRAVYPLSNSSSNSTQHTLFGTMNLTSQQQRYGLLYHKRVQGME